MTKQNIKRKWGEFSFSKSARYEMEDASFHSPGRAYAVGHLACGEGRPWSGCSRERACTTWPALIGFLCSQQDFGGVKKIKKICPTRLRLTYFSLTYLSCCMRFNCDLSPARVCRKKKHEHFVSTGSFSGLPAIYYLQVTCVQVRPFLPARIHL